MFKIATKNKGTSSVDFMTGTDGEAILWDTEEEAKEQIKLFGIKKSPFTGKITNTKPIFFDWLVVPV